MFTIDAIIDQYFPPAVRKFPFIHKPLAAFLRGLFHEREFQNFEKRYPYLEGLDFVEKVLDHFDFGYQVSDREKLNIPASGRVILISNHPIGSLDGLALLKLVSEVRKDVRIIANELLTTVKPLRSMLLPVDAFSNSAHKENLKRIYGFLEDEGALIIFPAGEVSRASAMGIRDRKWRNGFLRFAEKTRSPILPMYVDGRNSWLFYGISMLNQPLSTLWLIREMFKQADNSIHIRISDVISHDSYARLGLPQKTLIKLFRRQVYELPKKKRRKHRFTTQRAIAHPEDRQQLKQEIGRCEELGATADGKRILLYRYHGDSGIMREIGRLREITFRAVGEGSGARRDIDVYDSYYDHLVLWDENDLEIVGAYRFGNAPKILSDRSAGGLYLESLYDFHDGIQPILDQGLELGRSFVQPKYQGKRSLDYLWYGIGAYLKANPALRYLFGPISLSAQYPASARDLLITFYTRYFGRPGLVRAHFPYEVDETRSEELAGLFSGDDYDADFKVLKSRLKELGCPVPVLYKQYTESAAAEGVSFLGFSVDPDFSNCVDGLIVVDINHLTEKRRKRYMAGE